MVDAFHNESGLVSTALRPIRKKFAKPPVKVACLPWYVTAPGPSQCKNFANSRLQPRLTNPMRWTRAVFQRRFSPGKYSLVTRLVAFPRPFSIFVFLHDGTDRSVHVLTASP